MILTFKCSKCGKRKYFSFYQIINNKKVCLNCFNIIEKEKEKSIKKKEHEKRKIERRKKAREIVDKELLEEFKERKKVNVPTIKKKKIKTSVLEKEVVKEIKKETSLEKEAEKLSSLYDTVLYIYVDVKRIKAIEWIKRKKRVALNKEREVRHTHKGGFSQEKFQKFVDTKKKQTPQWVEDVLLREGVLRPPYEEVVVDCADDDLKEKVMVVLRREGILI